MPKSPAKAIAAAYKILRPRGQIMILDLLKHNFEKAHELYGDRWPGFAESDLHRWLEDAGFKKIEISVVAREEQPPHFQTMLAGGESSLAPAPMTLGRTLVPSDQGPSHPQRNYVRFFPSSRQDFKEEKD